MEMHGDAWMVNGWWMVIVLVERGRWRGRESENREELDFFSKQVRMRYAPVAENLHGVGLRQVSDRSEEDQSEEELAHHSERQRAYSPQQHYHPCATAL
jgi:hypothetical protein